VNSKAVGELSEAIILAHLMRKGWAVSVPFGNNERYDMLIDTRPGILRAQCKTARYIHGCIEFASSSKNGFTGVRSPYAGQVDVFLIYSSYTEQVYMFPVELAGPTFVRLRVEQPKEHGGGSPVKWAEDYVI
jgi:hypothetical protein